MSSNDSTIDKLLIMAIILVVMFLAYTIDDISCGYDYPGIGINHTTTHRGKNG